MSSVRSLYTRIVGIITLYILCVSPASAQILSSAQFKNLIVGNTIYAETKQGAPWRLYAGESGEVHFHFASGLVQRGRYWFSGEAVCFRLPDISQDCRLARIGNAGRLDWVSAEDRRTVTSYVLNYSQGDPLGIRQKESGKFFPVVDRSDPFTEGEHADAGQNWIQVYSRTNLGDAQTIAQDVKEHWPYTEIFLARNGWYAVAIGQVKTLERERYLRDWKNELRIPYDSIATSGRNYLHRIPVSGYRPKAALDDLKSTRKFQPTQSVTTNPSTRSRPRACYRISDHCLELSAKAVGCGFLAQAGLDSAFNTDSGALGGIASSVACTALVSDMHGLPVSAADLALAGFGGLVTSEAQQSLEEGDFLAALLQGAIAFGAVYASSLQCETALRQACR